MSRGGGPQQEGKAVPPAEGQFTGMCAPGRSLARLQSRVMVSEIVLDLEQDDDDPDRVRLQDGAASLLGGGWRKGPPAS